MKRNFQVYHNIKNWKVRRGRESYSIIPSPWSTLINAIICLPLFAGFYWFVHYKADIPEKSSLLMADAILFGTFGVLLAICVFNSFKTRRDNRAYLFVDLTNKTLELPRQNVKVSILDSGYLIAHDVVKGKRFCSSELNFIRKTPSSKRCIPILHILGPYRGFDKIGNDLKNLGVPFEIREGKVS